MEFIINHTAFKNAVLEVGKIVSEKATLPILSGIKIIAEKDNLTIIGSNSDLVIEKIIPTFSNGSKVVEVLQPGSIVISAKYLSEIVKKLPNEIYFTVNENNRVTIQSDNISSRLNGFSALEYPNLPLMDDTQYIPMASKVLIEMLKQTVFAVSKNETRPVLTGVYFHFSKGQLTCVATNSIRLALSKRVINVRVNCSCVVPSHTINELSKLMNNTSETIDIFISDHYIMFESTMTKLYSRILVGTYPHILRLIPQEFQTTITMERKQLLNGIDRATLFSSVTNNNKVYLELQEGSKIKIRSHGTELGQIEETQYLKGIQGERELSIAVDGGYLIEALKALKEDEISLSFSGPMKPILLKPIGLDDQLHLISPVRT
jgi:DNA polymerase III subunit beta